MDTSIHLEMSSVDTAVKQDSKAVSTISRVMVVDDDASASTFYVRALEKQGYDVDAFAEGEAAVEFYREHGDDVRLVILDMVMPGMDGPAVFRSLKEIDPDVTVVLASGFAVDAEAEACMREGAREFLVKPLLIDDLYRVVNTYAGSQS